MVVVCDAQIHYCVIQLVSPGRLQVREALKEVRYGVISWELDFILLTSIIKGGMWNRILQRILPKKVCQFVIDSFHLLHFSIRDLPDMQHCSISRRYLHAA